MIADDLTAIVEGAYAMALDPALTDNWVRKSAHAFGARVCNFAALAPDGSFRHRVQHGNEFLDRYIGDGIYLGDPQVSFAAALVRPTLYRDTDHRDQSDQAVRDHDFWLRCYLRIDHYMTACIRLGDGMPVGLSLHRDVDAGHVPDSDMDRLGAIFPALGAAFQLGFDHAEKLVESFWEGIASTTAEPAFLLDEHGDVVRMTECAHALLARSDAIDIVGGRLRCGEPGADDRLQRAVTGALRLPLGTAGGVRLPHRSGRAPLVVTVYPLARSQRVLAPYEAAALVTIVDPSAPARAIAPRHAEIFDLTPREGELAAMLLAGHSVESASSALGISVATGRLHLRRLLAKTGTTRQVDLIRLLARIGG